MIEVHQSDLYTLLVGSVRYALGRRSYVVGLTAEIVRRHWRDLSTTEREVIMRDLRAEVAAADRRGYESALECRTWTDLVRDLEAKS